MNYLLRHLPGNWWARRTMAFPSFVFCIFKRLPAAPWAVTWCLACSVVHAQNNSTQLQAPTGGWRASLGENNFVQEVNYPASKVNLREGTSLSAQIKGQIRAVRKNKKPPTLIVNGVAMPLETDEAGQFARPYSFAAGSNSVEVRTNTEEDMTSPNVDIGRTRLNLHIALKINERFIRFTT